VKVNILTVIAVVAAVVVVVVAMVARILLLVKKTSSLIFSRDSLECQLIQNTQAIHRLITEMLDSAGIAS
jgi:hypothetical protein